MYCNNCGAQLTENSKFCPNCGQLVQSTPQEMTAASTYEGPMGNPTPVLVWGIIGLAFACTFVASFLGIIFIKTLDNGSFHHSDQLINTTAFT